MNKARHLTVPLQNGGAAVFPVPMSRADYELLCEILSAIKKVHVCEPDDPPVEMGMSEKVEQGYRNTIANRIVDSLIHEGLILANQRFENMMHIEAGLPLPMAEAEADAEASEKAPPKTDDG